MSGKPVDSFAFGFDVGVNSIGWCVLDEKHATGLGLRCFGSAKAVDKGELLDLVRRITCLMRRHHRR